MGKRGTGEGDDGRGHSRPTAVRGMKPPGMRAASFLERRILEAQAAGEFDDLPGKGKPDPKLHRASDPLWWAKELMARENLSGALPPALELRRDVEETLGGLERVAHVRKARERLEALNRRIRNLNRQAHSGPATRLSPLDVEEILEQWRQRRARIAAAREAEARD